MKKYINLLSAVLLLSLVACGTDTATNSNNGGNGSNGNNNNNNNNSNNNDNSGNNTSYGNYDYIPDEDSVEWIDYPKKQKEEHQLITVEDVSYVRVFAPNKYKTIYAWLGSGNTATKLLGEWPGTDLKEYNSDWKYYDFTDKTNVNIIFSNQGAGQTADLTADRAGNWWFNGSGLVSSNTEPKGQTASKWTPKKASNIYVGNTEDYSGPDKIIKPTVNKVDYAKDYTELPVIKNWNKNSIVNKYDGDRDDFRDESIYFAITTRFYDADKSNNTHCWDAVNDEGSDPNWRGDFKGLIEKMDYIKAQGFTAIWITPIVKNASGFDYHGYHAINFKQVDPRYESSDVSFQTVINEAHKRDMKIVLDIVLNHTSNFGEENLFPMFYYDAKHNTSFNGMIRNNTSYGILPDSYDTSNNPGQMRFDYLKTESGDPNNIYHHDPDGSLSWEQYSEVTGQIAGDCVDLNTENPTVANYLVEAYAKFIHMGVDAFRIDAVKHLSRLSLNKYYLPAFHYIAEKCGNPNFYMFGEVCVKDNDVWNRGQQSDAACFYTWNDNNSSYAWGDLATNMASAKSHWEDHKSPEGHPTSNNAYLNNMSYHAPDHSKASYLNVIDFPMHWNFDNASNSFNVAKNNDSVYNDATYNVVYVDSHDYAPNEQQTVRYNYDEGKWKENLSLMFTFRGIPCVFYGSEVQFKKGKTIDNGPNLALENSGRAYFGDYIEGSVNVNDFGQYSNASGNMANTLNSGISKHIQKLSKIRLAVPALRRGQYATNYSGSGMGFTRIYSANGKDSIAAVVINGSGSFNSLPDGIYHDLFNNNKEYRVSGSSVYVSANGQGSVAILVKD